MNSKSKTPRMADSNDGGRVAAAAIDALDDDTLTQILLRLPAKSVFRSKFVCKQWLSLISSGQFLRDYTLRHRESQPPLILHTFLSNYFYLTPNINRENPLMKRCTFPPLQYDYLKIWSSCNGLLLLECYNRQTEYYVYNPTTEQSRKINLLVDDDSKYRCIVGLILAFDPSKSPHYKIVCVRTDEKPREFRTRSYQIEVYNSAESPACNIRSLQFTDSHEMNFSSCVHCNNKIYGKTSHGPLYYFDIDKNVFRYLREPPQPKRGAIQRSRLQESNGCLYYIAIISQRQHAPESVTLWELQGVDHSPPWLLKYPDRGISNLNSPTYPLRFNRGSDGGETNTLVTHDKSAGRIMVYSFLHGSFEELVDLTQLQPLFYGNVMNLNFEGVHQFVSSPATV